jgi:hypothetical protein
VRMSTSLKPTLSFRRSSVCASSQDRRRSLTVSFSVSFWNLIKRRTRLQQRLGAGASLAGGTRIVIVCTSLGVHVNRYIANVLLHNDFTVWKFSYNCNGYPLCLILFGVAIWEDEQFHQTVGGLIQEPIDQ